MERNHYVLAERGIIVKKNKMMILMMSCLMLVCGCSANTPKLDEVIAQVNMMPSYNSLYEKSDLVQVYYTETKNVPIELSKYFDEFYDCIYSPGYTHNDVVNADSVYYVLYSIEGKSFLGSTALYYEKNECVASVNNAEIYINSPYEIETPSEIENKEDYEWQYCESEELNKLKDVFK